MLDDFHQMDIITDFQEENENEFKEQFNGIQHIGIPTNDIEATIDFYKALGFEIAFRTVNEEADEEVAFLKLNTLVVETYENKAAKMEAGAIDHMAIDVKDIEKVYEMINQAGLNTTNDTVHFLPFWENGVKFFTIEDRIKRRLSLASIYKRDNCPQTDIILKIVFIPKQFME